jgi:biotin carboxyl carrier protein
MKYHLNIQGKSFEVEISNPYTQPIIAVVNGEPIEVWVGTPHPAAQHASPTILADQDQKFQSKGEQKPSHENGINQQANGKSIRSPIPGVIISISVKEGSQVSIGQELCVLEAMKMKNAIRSPRDGIIASVLVIPGQTVQHHDVLMEFSV